MGCLSVVVYVCKIMLQGIYSHHPIDPLTALLHPVFLERVRMLHSRDQQSPQLASQRSLLLRSLFVVSLMCRHFDFDQVAMEVPLPDLVSGAVGPSINSTLRGNVKQGLWMCRLLLFFAACMLKQVLACYGVVVPCTYVLCWCFLSVSRCCL